MIQGAAFRVLACFYDNDKQSFTELCSRAGYPTDLGGYYIRQLLEGNFLEKVDRGQYRVLPKGKQQLAFNYGKQLFAPKPRLSIVIIATQGQSFIVLRRKVQPFIGVAEWPAGVVNVGEEVQAAAQRVLRVRLGIEVPMTLCGFFRRIDTYAETLFDDKLFAVHTCSLPEDLQPILATTLGENLLFASDDLQRIDRPSRSLLDILHYAQEDGDKLQEYTYKLTAVDLALTEQ
jgi:predicted transcriptional regulator